MAVRRTLLLEREDLYEDFDHGTVERGVKYASEGRVFNVVWSDDEPSVSGVCVGSGRQVYQPAVAFEIAGSDCEIVWAECTCPVGIYCKHTVALLIAVAGGSTPSQASPEPPQWRSVLGTLLDETPAAAISAGGLARSIGLRVSIAAPTKYARGETVKLRPMTIGKRGTWIRTGLTWNRLMFNPDSDDFDRQQFMAMRDIIETVRKSDPYNAGDEISLTAAPPAVWTLLDNAIHTGVTLVADKASGFDNIEFIKAAQLRHEFSADEFGDGGAMMSTVLVVDGVPWEPHGVGLVGQPNPHGMYKVVDRTLMLGPFDPVPGRTALDLIARDERIHIPADAADEFALEVLPRLAAALPVEIEEGLFTPATITGPVPVLSVDIAESGNARAWWSVRYEVNDQRHDFDPASSVEATPFRDAGIEDDSWSKIDRVLREVAAAAQDWKAQGTRIVQHMLHRHWSADTLAELEALNSAEHVRDAVSVSSAQTLRAGVDLTPVQAARLCAEVLPQFADTDDIQIEISEGVSHFRSAQNPPEVQFSADEEAPQNDWFDLRVSLNVDGRLVPIADVITELSSGATHMLLADGVYFTLDTPELVRLAELIAEARALGEIESGKVHAGSYNVTLWEEMLALGVVDEQVAVWQRNLTRLSNACPPMPVDVPQTLQATLRDYQRDGLDWLAFLWDNGLGGILADDMGLGKTVQTLGLISRAQESGCGPFLVIAPTSVVTNWVAECHKFTPDLNAVAVTATEAKSGVSLAAGVSGVDIVVTSYTLLRIDFDEYDEIDWAGVIFDEAQFVKNHNGKTHQCARRLNAPFKLAITGTPMENNLMDLWALLSLTAPGLFASPKAFTDYFRKPVESGKNPERLPVLRRRIKPVMLRRTKDQVVTDLPAKQEQVLTVNLAARHQKIYETRLARERQKVLGLLGDWEKNRFQIFRSLTMLRQLSLHAGLVDKSKSNVESAKVTYLIGSLPELVAEGHSALVFSQFTGFLDILRTHLDAAGVAYSYLDGSLTSKKRQAAIKAFTDGKTQVFLISLKAGGFGLNLTAADYCFVCDPWWNPAAEAQAVDRAHRIGQQRPVTVYRLVSGGTVEEKVVALQERKRELFSAVVDDGEMFGSAISASDIREMLE